MVRVLSLSFFISLFFTFSFASTSYEFLLSRHKPKRFQSSTKHQISYYHIINKAKPILVICPGYSEPAAKYLELVKDLGASFEIYIIDHRGQGLSDRLNDYKHVSYIEKFDNFIFDLDKFSREVIEPQKRKSFILAHSMGGFIAIKYLMSSSSLPYSGAVLNSPMLEINLSPIPNWLAPYILKVISMFNLLEKPIWGKGENAIRGPFLTNRVTSSRIRWQAYRDLLKMHPEMAINGMTWNWMKESYEATTSFVSDEKQVTVPTLLLQAEKDRVVVNSAQNEFCDTQELCSLKTLKKGKHELLFEVDEIRKKTVQYILEFYQSL